MDGESFDRLSVTVDRLRDRATRRGALGIVLGGALVAASRLRGDGAVAKNKNKNNKNKNGKKKCRGYGGKCDRTKDCCSGSCRNGRCWYTGNGGGGGGKKCGGRTCPSGWRCCKRNGIAVCTPPTYPTCCDNFGYPSGYFCCTYGGGACLSGRECCPGLTTGCCQEGWKCCGDGRCCPDGWECGDFVCYANQDAEIASAAVETIPSVEAEPVDENDRFALEGVQASADKP
jgi:hypothetical protein